MLRLSLRQSFIGQIEWREKGIAEPFHSLWPQLWIQKTKAFIYEISRMSLFDFTHFANFKFAYFEIEESFGLI